MHRRDFIRNGTLAALSVAAGVRAKGQPAAGGRRLRVAQIGTAHAHAAEKWATLQKFPEVFDCVGICEPDAAMREQAVAEPRYRAARWLGEAELFARREIDAVLVETELPDLVRYGERVLRAGWHLHLDKPPGRKLADFDALQTLAANGGRVFQQGYMYRYHPAFRFCFEAAEQGWLGRIFSIHGDIGKARA